VESPAWSKIRLARPSDVPELLAMMGTFNRAEHVTWRKAQVLPALRKLLREPSLGRVVVAEGRGGGELRGYAVATFGYDLEFAGRDAFLTELFVRSRFRRTGEGQRLLGALMDEMRGAGAAAIHLLVWPANRAARRLYQAAGFTPVPRLVMSQRWRGVGPGRRQPARPPASGGATAPPASSAIGAVSGKRRSPPQRSARRRRPG
jgi:ribosomal protein S18 acetylase RimI-like enzyme